MRTLYWTLSALFVLVASPALPRTAGPSVVGAQSPDRRISLDRFHGEYVVDEGGSTHVTETLEVRFEGSWNGVIRDISLRHQTAEARRTRLDLEVTAVTDAAGNELRAEESGDRNNRRVQIWVPGAEDAVRTVVLRYTVSNAIRFFGPDAPSGHHDELYWNVTGNEWTMPIRRATATVVLPEAVTDVEAWAYTGTEGSRASEATVAVRGNTVDVATTRELAPGEGLTVSVNWPPGTVAGPSPAARLADRVRGAWPLALPLLVLGFMTRRWQKRGRDPRKRAISVQYEPVEDMSPAEMGTLVDHKADQEDLAATLVDLAVRGFLTIEERKQSRFLGLAKSTEYVFHLRRPPDQWNGLRPHERLYLAALFPAHRLAGVDAADAVRAAVSRLPGVLAKLIPDRTLASLKEVAADLGEPAEDSPSSGAGGAAERDRRADDPTASESAAGGGEPLASVELSDLKNKFYRHLEGIRNAVYDRLVKSGYYRERPDKVLRQHFGGAGVIGGAGVAGALWVANGGPYLADPLFLVVAGLASAAVVAGFALIMPARTERGARAREQALGFKEFLERVETDRYRRMITSPELFERFLPYAMAFGVEDRWAGAFRDLIQTPPEWYHGHDASGFRTDHFTRDLGRMTSEAGSTMSSSPSSGSGSGGGGSSGGGSGGGGGSGF